MTTHPLGADLSPETPTPSHGHQPRRFTRPVISTEGGNRHPESSRPTTGRMEPGTRVLIERDETRYPSRGSWPQYRGRTGIVVEVNRAGKGATEYGVAFGAVRARRSDLPGQFAHGGATWFKRHEMTVLDRPDFDDAA